MSLFPKCTLKDIKTQSCIGHIKCPFCITTGNRKSKIFETKKAYLFHISKHDEISDGQKRAARYYGTNYFVMLAGGMLS